MEKYKKYTDHATGINPFVPLKPARQSSGFISLLFINAPRNLIGTVFSIVRMSAVLVVLLVMFVSCAPFSFLGGLGRLITRPLYLIFCRLSLLILGFWWIPTSTATVKNRVVRRPSAAANASMGSGDLIISNHNSYVDILYFGFKYSPVFTTVNAKGKVKIVGIFSALWAAFTHSTGPQSGGISLKAALKQACGPLLVFPEGATFNGKGVMGFTPVLDDFIPKKPGRGHPQLRMVVVQYPFSRFSPTFPVGSGFAHLFWLCAQFYNKLEVKNIGVSDMPAIPDDDQDASSAYTESLRDTMANALRVQKIADLTVSNKSDFLNFWGQKQRGYKS